MNSNLSLELKEHRKPKTLKRDFVIPYDERTWGRDKRLLSNQYWRLNNLYWIADKDANRVLFRFNNVQNDFYRSMWFWNLILKSRQHGFCLDPETLILTSDLKWIKIGDIELGQKIIGVDEYSPDGRGHSRKMRTGVVYNTCEVICEAFRIELDNGKSLICSGHHPWLSRKVASDTRWRKIIARNTNWGLNVGTKIRSITEPWNQFTDYEDGWIGGVIDGEGSVNYKRSGTNLGITQSVGAVLDKTRQYLNNNRYHYREEIDKRKPVHTLAISRMDEIFQLIGKTRPSRFIGINWWEGKDLPGKKSGIGWSKVVVIEKLGERTLIDLQTSTGTYIAEGFVSHNSSLVDILALDYALFNNDITINIIAHKLDDAETLFAKKIEYPYLNLPAEIREARPAKSKTVRTLKFNNNSEISVDTSARSDSLNFLHICLSGDTEILTKNAVVKEITDIKKDDLILTSSGSYRKVKELVKNKLSDIGENMVAIESYGYYTPLKLTENHKVMCRPPIVNGKKPKSKDFIWKQAKDIKKKDYIAFPIRNDSMKLRTGTLPIGNKRIKVDYDLGWLVGLYLAEGSIRKHRYTETVFCLHSDEINNFIEFIGKFSGYYSKYRIYNRKGSKSTAVTVVGKDFTEFIIRFFGNSDDKIIPDAVWGYGRKFIEGLIKGYIDGDVSYKNLNEVKISSVRRQLIDQLRMLIISLRFGYPSIYHRKHGEFYNRNCREIWTLSITGAANWRFREHFGLELPQINTYAGKWRLMYNAIKKVNINPIIRKFWRRGENVYWAQVTNVYNIPQEEYVYDIVLDEEPYDYVTVNGVVHNSEFGKICLDHPDKAAEIVNGSIPAVHTGNLLFIESTSEGSGGYFADWCKEAHDRELQGIQPNKRQMKLYFYPWYEAHHNRLDPIGIQIYPWLNDYFTELKNKYSIELDDKQKAWYANEVTLLKDNMKREHPSYYEEAFEQSTEGAYYFRQFQKIRTENRITKVPHDSSYSVDVSFDIGVDDATSAFFIQIAGREIHIINCYENSGEGIKHYVNMLDDMRKKYGYRYGRFIGPHDLSVREFGNSAITRWQSAANLGVKFDIAPNIPIADGIEAVRTMLDISWFDEEKCHEGYTKLERYRKEYDARLNKFRDRPRHDDTSHFADSLRYYAVTWRQVMHRANLNIEPKEISRGSWT